MKLQHKNHRLNGVQRLPKASSNIYVWNVSGLDFIVKSICQHSYHFLPIENHYIHVHKSPIASAHVLLRLLAKRC